MKSHYTYQLLILLFFNLPFLTNAQSVTGKVLDYEDHPLELVSVALINPADSTLVSYTTSNKNGYFELIKVRPGELIFQLNMVGFQTYQKIIEYKGESINMGTIKLKSANELDEIVVRAITPVTIKKDTVSYNTNAFKVRTDDSVEDLLKKLPGIEVDAAGKITAQGEEVKKVYVNGKEFFSGDPTIATKNLSADAIKNIEVIDEKSEKARISGQNDLDPSKVINLKLKDNKKVNDFGKFQGGYGTDDRFLTSANYNRFTEKLQVSFIGKYNNINTTGSDISDIMVFNVGGGRMFGSGGSSINSGFVTTGIGGLNMTYEFKKKQDLNADYFYNYTNNNSGDVYTNRTEFIGDAEIYSENHSKSETTQNKNSVNFNYRDRSKKLSSILINGNAGYSRTEGTNINELDKYNADQALDLQSIGSALNNSKNKNANIEFDYNQRLNENSKRAFEISSNFNLSSNNSTSSNDQINRYNVADPDETYESLQQTKRDQNFDQLSAGINLEYTEPITDVHLLEFRAGVRFNKSDDDVNQRRFEDGTEINPLIYDQYYRNTNLAGGLYYKYDKEKYSFWTGVDFVDMFQDFGLRNDEEYNNKFTTFNPSVNFRYRPKRGEWLRIRLRRSLDLPNINQLSPVINDFDPLNVRMGNPELTPEENYSFFAMYGKHNFKNGLSFFAFIRGGYIKNSIVNNNFTDPNTLIRYSTYENLGDRKSTSLTLNHGNRLQQIGLRYNIRLSGSYSEYLSIVNLETNETNSKDGSLSLSLENDKKEKIDASIGASWRKNYTTFTTGRNTERDFLQQTYYAKADYNISDRLNLTSQFKYDIYTDSNFDSRQAIPIWNASMSYFLDKKKSLSLTLSALDILNKNIGIVRNSSDNYFEETHRDVLGNYYMLSLTYNLNGNQGPKSSGRSRGHRMRRMH